MCVCVCERERGLLSVRVEREAGVREERERERERQSWEEESEREREGGKEGALCVREDEWRRVTERRVRVRVEWLEWNIDVSRVLTGLLMMRARRLPLGRC